MIPVDSLSEQLARNKKNILSILCSIHTPNLTKRKKKPSTGLEMHSNFSTTFLLPGATIFVAALRDNLSFCPVKLHTLAIVCEKSVQSQRLQASGVSGLKPVTICDAVIPETKRIDPCLTGLILVNHRGVYMDRRQLRFKSAIFHWGVGNGENMLSNGSPQDYKAINYRTTYHVNCDLIYHVQRPQSVAWPWGASIFESSSRLAKGNAFCADLPLFSLSFANLFSAFRAAFRRSLSSPCFIVWRIPQNSTFGRSQVRQILRLLLQISFKYPAL